MCFRIVEGKEQRSGSHAVRQADSRPHAAAPAFQFDEITGGKAQITGSFTEQEATELAAKINEAVGVRR